MSKYSNIHCCIGKVFTFYVFKLTCTSTREHGTSHFMRWISLPGTYCVQYQLMNEAASQRLNQDYEHFYPTKLLMLTCVHSRTWKMSLPPNSPGLVTWPDVQWQRLRSPGCWRWKTLCWNPWRMRLWRWMAFRVVWCRSIQVRPFGTKLSGAAWAIALSWETEDAVARPEELLIWLWGCVLNTLQKPAGMWVCEARESISSSTDWILQAHKMKNLVYSPDFSLHVCNYIHMWRTGW